MGIGTLGTKIPNWFQEQSRGGDLGTVSQKMETNMLKEC